MHQLALFTLIRRQICQEEDPPVKQLITKTKILNVAARILAYVSDDPFVYYLKLESLWILNNLCFTKCQQELQMVLCSEPDQFLDVYYSHSEGVLELTSKMMESLIDENCQDLKSLHLIFQLLQNIAATSDEFAARVMNETIILKCVIATLSNNNKLDVKIIEEAICIVSQITRRTEMQQSTILQMVQVARVGLEMNLPEIKTPSLRIIRDFCFYSKHLIPTIVEGSTLTHVIQALSHTNAQVKLAAVEATSSILSTEEDSVLDRFNQEDYLDKITYLLYSQDSSIHQLCLWGISNFVLNEKYVIAFFQNEQLASRVMILMRLAQDYIRSEAGFVISNALTSCTTQILKQIFDSNRSDLTELLVGCLRSTPKSDVRLRKNLLEALSRLLKLDHQFPGCSDEDTVAYHVQLNDGIEIIEQCCLSEDSDLLTLAQNVLESHFSQDGGLALYDPTQKNSFFQI